MMKKKGYKNGGALTGGRKKLDKNNDGEISGDDFAMMRKDKGVKSARGGGMMKKKGFANGGMMKKKGYAMGGAMKKKGMKKGGKVRGAGIARKGVRPAKMV